MKWMFALVAVVIVAPGTAQAQNPTRPGDPRYGFPPGEHHGRLGVLVNTQADPETDSIGAHIEAVTPGSPAARAGLKAGDVITKFSGSALAGATSEEAGGSGPGRKLVELARALEPGDSVRVEYRRGVAVRTTTLVAGDVSVISGVDRFAVPPGLPGGRVSMIPGPDDFMFCFGEWCDMQIVSLNPDLGEYFGTKEGILVVKASGDTSLPLKSGDVILAIGGRKPTSAAHAMRILRSYEAGETVSIDIMRRQKRATITWHVPARDNQMHHFRFREMRPDSEGGDAPQG
ncbi:MAG TPA: PDZ domain-containing protein [Gemmatimonadales bacterium]|nr:PDZ domain-containing protein [Gemmatimonadales bacterium]